MKLGELIERTRRERTRQYATRRIGAFDFKYVARSHQLFITATAFPLNPDGGRTSPYKLSLIFDKITSADMQDRSHTLRFVDKDTDSLVRFLDLPTVQHNCRVRCQCADFYFMWQYYDKQNKALIGPHVPYVRLTTTRPPVNPNEAPGLCKHLLQMVKFLMDNNIIQKNVKAYQYFTRPTRM